MKLDGRLYKIRLAIGGTIMVYGRRPPDLGDAPPDAQSIIGYLYEELGDDGYTVTEVTRQADIPTSWLDCIPWGTPYEFRGRSTTLAIWRMLRDAD